MTASLQTPWPGGAPFALFLSHDVDDIHDRTFYRTLGELNHLRRVVFSAEQGDARACSARIRRSFFRPNDPRLQFERILRIEAGFGWHSTFFFLEGYRWSRFGSRYSLRDPIVGDIASMILEAGCEIAVHGAYHDLDRAGGYGRTADRIQSAFGVRPVGIRNHYLRFSGGTTWEAQAEAGFEYDATFGWSDRLGPRDGRWHPFRPTDSSGENSLPLVVLPLTIMDTTVFRYLRMGLSEALEAVDSLLATAAAIGGLVSVLWHNNYFGEPEYAEWEELYIQILRRAAVYEPYCATGALIAREWAHTNAQTETPI